MRVESGKEVPLEVPPSEAAVPVYGSGADPFKYTVVSISDKPSILFGRKGTLGQPYIVEPPFWAVDTAYIGTPRKGMDIQYLNYLLQVFDWRPFVTNTAKPSLVANDILPEKVPLPSECERTRILHFLVRKSAEIDGLVGKLHREAELLERYRREVSWEALTGGLEKASHKVESEVDWIGLMPESWTTIPGRHLFEVVKRIEPGFSDRVLSITQKGIVPKDLSSHFGQLAESYDLYQRVDAGDYAMNSMDLLTGWVDRSAYDGVTSPDYRVFRLRRAIAAEPRYFTRVLQMGYTRRIFYRYGQGVSNLGRWRLQPKVFLNMRFPLPPLNQQRRIADYIEEKYAEIDSTIAGINRQIGLLGEYRKQVINDVVTGKVRVGEVA
jgi:type I restriction modification DNA specificity domain protein